MALDLELFDTYKRYKAGTANLATWLATAARKTNLVEDVFPKSVSKGRLKGKERAAQNNKTETYQIRLADFTRMAEAVAAKETEVVPWTLIRTIEEVIAARKQCTQCFEQKTSNDTSSRSQVSNATHRHFIRVLENTYRILKSVSEEPKKAKKDPDQEHKDVHKKENVERTNLYEYLEVDEPAEWAFTNPPKPVTTATNSIYELEPTDEDVSFAIYCLFKDSTDVSHYVRTTWTEYREGQIAFTTAALTMNTAISIFRRLNEEFMSNFPQFDDRAEIISYIYTDYCDPNSQDSNNFATYSGNNFKLSSKAFFCNKTHEIASNFLLGEAGMPFYQVDVDDDFLRHTPYEIVLLKFGKHLDCCLNEARQLQKWMPTTIADSLLFGKTNVVNDWYKLNTNILSQTKKVIVELLENDIIQGELEAAFSDVPDRLKRYSWGPFFLFRNHPMLLGLITQHFLTRIHELGVGLGRDQGSIITTIHLYDAIQQINCLPKPLDWLDLENVVAWQPPSQIFFGGVRPTTPADYFSHLGRAMGISTVVLGRDRRGKGAYDFEKKGLPQAKNGIRGLKLMSQYAEFGITARPFAKPGTPRWLPSRASKEPLVMLEMILAKRLERDFGISRGHTGDAQQRLKLDPKHMIAIFKDYLKTEEHSFRFDLFKLNQRCIELLREIQNICLNQSPLDYPEEEWASDRNLNQIIRHMLAGELGLERYQPTRFAEASVMTQKLIKAKGDFE